MFDPYDPSNLRDTDWSLEVEKFDHEYNARNKEYEKQYPWIFENLLPTESKEFGYSLCSIYEIRKKYDGKPPYALEKMIYPYLQKLHKKGMRMGDEGYPTNRKECLKQIRAEELRMKAIEFKKREAEKVQVLLNTECKMHKDTIKTKRSRWMKELDRMELPRDLFEPLHKKYGDSLFNLNKEQFIDLILKPK